MYPGPAQAMTAGFAPATLRFDAAGIPRSEAYDDVYHASAGGPAQARHVFLAGNGLPARWRGRKHFTVLETGFGLGLNFMATWQAWADDPQACEVLHFVSLEKHPLSAADLARAHAAWPEFAPFSADLLVAWPALESGTYRIALAAGRLMLELVFADAVDALPGLKVSADACYLDGFSPAKNPDLWSPEVCRALAAHAAPGATLATWSVAGAVRRALVEAGFALTRRPGFAGKREMLTGVFAGG